MSQLCTNTPQILPSVGEDVLNLILLVQLALALQKMTTKEIVTALQFLDLIPFLPPSFPTSISLSQRDKVDFFVPLYSVPGTAWNACSGFTATAWKRNSGKKYSRIFSKKQRGTMKLVIITGLPLLTLW